MDIQQLLERLPEELRQRGLPDAYIARYVAELREHISDLIEERKLNMSKDAQTDAEIAARIGTPVTLAKAASVEFTRRSFCGRHPIVTFLIAPVPLAVFAWIVTFATMFGCTAGAMMFAERLGAAPSADSLAGWPTAAILGLTILFWLGVVGPPAMLTMLLCRLAHRNGLSWRWALAASVIVALIAGLFQAALEPAATGDGHGRLTFGFGLWMFPPLQQWLQFAFPLLIGLGFLWRQTHPPVDRTPPLVEDTFPQRQAA